ncbi:carbon-nitrogen hydrolase family protein [Arthrobacter sp. HMWF013]|uniref:carbon-nitrogen hydrolase family protein n=1 Tax=Arthrobacter sp. HMWF013 TaxID=2056849 RepID=UPI000D3B9F4F|nr:carbon-nitrogen hydrolase family protein [Arthrobacter sp. HMWF013]PTT61585.1 carbon-nitrogen hydrolase family protein [Arthrobacter sp. HMWF013]
MTEALTVSAIQYQALDGGIIPNAQEHVRLIEDAESHGARLVVFPGLSLTGHNFAQLAAEDSWLRPDDARLDDLHEICRRSGITAVAGAAYREPDGTPRMACLAMHPDGTTETGFKTRLSGVEEQHFTAGAGSSVLELDGWRIALAICSEAEDPVHCTAAGLAGVDICAVSAVYAQHDKLRLGLHLEALASDNRIFGLLANLAGSTPSGPSSGLSGFWGPDGLQLRTAAGTGAEVVTAILQRSALRKFR